MQSKTFALFALSASAAVASPFHKRQELQHFRRHGTGTGLFRPTGSAGAFPAPGNDTTGPYAPPTGEASILPVSTMTKTVSPMPSEADDINTAVKAAVPVDATTSCVSTSIATATSTNFITVTASGADLGVSKVVEATNSVNAGAFYGGQSWSRGGGWGESTSAAAPSAPAASGVPSGNPSTTFATMTSGAGASSTSAATSATASAPASGSSGGKRGISFNEAGLVSAFGSSVSWAYNWASTESGSLNGVEYVPMMWGQDDVSGFADLVGSATHVLSFNEPDLGEQANIDPSTAASLHKQAMSGLVGQVQIGSPAVTNGAGTSPLMGIDWLNAFFDSCGTDCPVDFIAYHWYATADSIDYFKSHTQDIINVAKNNGIDKVWLTEFKPEGSADAQASFMQEAVAFLDSTPEVERYAAFMASEGTLLSGNSLNSVGSAYAGSS